MEQIQLLTTRRALFSWRDRWLEQVDTQLTRELPELRLKLESQIDSIDIKGVMFNDSFIKNKLHPMLAEWLSVQTNALLMKAREELVELCDKAIEVNEIDSQFKDQPVTQKLIDIATASLSTGAIFVAIPTAIGAATVTASVGGVLGLLGVTATVVSAPAVAVGAAVVLTTGFLARHRINKVKTNSQERLKENLTSQIQEKALFNRQGTSLNQVLQGAIENTASTLLKELSHVD